jgi:hypothetical protein
MWEIIIPCLVFFILASVIYYFNSESENKLPKCIIPSLMVSIMVFIIIKYKVVDEPVMGGNYFD